MTTGETPRPERAGLSLDAPHLAIGICVTMLGVALTLDRLEILEAERILRFWPLGFVLLGAGMVAQAFWRGADEPAGRRRGGMAPLFLFGMLAIGLLIAPRLERQGSVSRDGRASAEVVRVFAILGEDQRISTASQFRGAEMTTLMGESELDLRQATIAPGEEAAIDVFAVMGGLVLRVPPEWTVDVRAVPVMGGVRDRRVRDEPLQTSPAVAAPRLVLRGLIVMGGLTITSADGGDRARRSSRRSSEVSQ